MPGAYAHLTLVGLLVESNSLNKADGFTPLAKAALMENAQFCDLGAVSPDYPYLNITHQRDQAWADLMHHENTGQMIIKGVEMVRAMSGQARDKAFAWLLGYVAHVVTDVTIHPVVQLKVGPYVGNERAHRICEMHQDAHIFQLLNVGEVGLAEYLDSGIWKCCDTPGSGRLDPAVSIVWQGMLQACYPEKCKSGLPDTDAWHKAFGAVVDTLEEGGKLPAFARHVAVNCGATYPAAEEIDEQYITGLTTPEGKMNYNAIFERTINNVLVIWSVIASAVYKGDLAYQAVIRNWNLDTGKDDDGNFVFWRERT